MNALAHVCYAFLKGERLTIKSVFRDYGYTNLPREVGRRIERKFDVTVVRTRKNGRSRYGMPCTWFEYRLVDSKENREGRIKIKKYILDQLKNPKTEREFHISKSITLL